jgi:hypothetical protein
MLDCFDGLISLDGTCAGNSGGVMSLQSLDGISESLIKDITGPEDTPASMLAQCEKWARAHMHNEVITHMAPRIIGRTFIDRKHIGEPDDDQELLSGTGIGGILVEIDQRQSNAVLRIGALGLYADFTGDVNIRIYDLEDGSEVDTYVITVQAGVSLTEDVQIILPAYRKRKAYFITHDLPDYYRTWTSGSCGSCHMGYYHGGVRVNGARLADGLQKKRTNLRISSETSGLMAVITVECDHAQMLCELRNALALPYLYKVGEALMRRGINAFARMNSTTINLDQLKENAAFYSGNYNSQMEKTLGKMRLPDDPMCFTCYKNARSVISIP